MTDYFALFDEPRRLWLDPERLKTRFLALSAELHPDKIQTISPADREAATHRFAELNSAFNCLRDPKERLRHLLKLEWDASPREVLEIPSDLAELFIEIARMQREANTFLAEAARVQSSLLKVQLFERAQALMERIRAVQTRLGGRQADLFREIQVLDAEWSDAGPDSVQRGVLLQRVERIHQSLSFYTRWDAQIQETLLRLSL